MNPETIEDLKCRARHASLWNADTARVDSRRKEDASWNDTLAYKLYTPLSHTDHHSIAAMADGGLSYPYATDSRWLDMELLFGGVLHRALLRRVDNHSERMARSVGVLATTVLGRADSQTVTLR